MTGVQTETGRSLPGWKRITYLALPWLVLATCAETTTRLLFDRPQPPPPMFGLTMSEPDPGRIWRYRPDYRQSFAGPEFAIDIRTGGWRLRDADPTGTADIRILFLGDSFTFGWGVESADRFTERLETLLMDSFPDRSIEILNAGHWSYSFDQQLLLLKELVPRFDPQVVVQGLYGSHVISMDEHRWRTSRAGTIEAVHFDGSDNEIVVAPDGSLRRTNRWIDSPPLGSRFVSKLSRQWFRWRQRNQAALAIADLFDPTSTRLDRAWSMTATAIQQTAAFLDTLAVAYLAFEVPLDVQVSESERAEWFRQETAGRPIDYTLVGARFGEIVSTTTGTWHPTLHAFRFAYDPSLYFSHDPHWTPAGHDLAAKLLLPVLVEALRQIIP